MTISDPQFLLREPLPLRAGEVHLWRVDLAATADGEPRWLEILSSDEQARAARFHFARDRRRFATTRALLRIVLASYLGSEPQELVFSYSEKGKPFLEPQSRDDRLEFNVSHSGELALMAFSRERQLGVDVEQIRENLDPASIARRYFSQNEQKQLAALEPTERYGGFFRCWTRKEAYIKARGDGLSLSLDSFDVSLAPGDHNALLSSRADGTEVTGWSLQDLSVAGQYAAALCVRGQGWRLIA